MYNCCMDKDQYKSLYGPKPSGSSIARIVIGSLAGAAIVGVAYVKRAKLKALLKGQSSASRW